VLRGWLLAHIQQEIGKGIPPPVADCDTAPSVPKILIVIWIETALAHFYPRVVFRGSASSMCASVGFSHFRLKTSARLNLTTGEVGYADNLSSAANARALPHSGMELMPHINLNSSESSELFTGQI
jgi:hypothetical protein